MMHWHITEDDGPPTEQGLYHGMVPVTVLQQYQLLVMQSVIVRWTGECWILESSGKQVPVFQWRYDPGLLFKE